MTLRHLDLSYLRLQAAVGGKPVTLRKVQSEYNMADQGTKSLEKDTTDQYKGKLG